MIGSVVDDISKYEILWLLIFFTQTRTQAKIPKPLMLCWMDFSPMLLVIWIFQLLQTCISQRFITTYLQHKPFLYTWNYVSEFSGFRIDCAVLWWYGSGEHSSQLWPMAPIVTSTSTCAYNTLRLERNGHQFADAIFKRNLIDSHFKVNSLGFNWQWFSFGLGDGLVLLGTKPLPNRCWPGYMTPYDLSRPQCVTQNIVYASANRKLKCHPQYIYMICL